MSLLLTAFQATIRTHAFFFGGGEIIYKINFAKGRERDIWSIDFPWDLCFSKELHERIRESHDSSLFFPLLFPEGQIRLVKLEKKWFRGL
ncbi:hypothetical protein WEN_01330 [Mycoplasma wenyonii str. Massachusetts]|uniref:Uncharacterized protein n=1 Tax=Mycoplasma wenyonii (strain Massachusetts) TaxID=1197325 RepID=I6ZIP6_MYCWM|nr:hypothetical protein WEN_01330 [Mycoplasma wenyonii str. Massachusetts]